MLISFLINKHGCILFVVGIFKCNNWFTCIFVNIIHFQSILIHSRKRLECAQIHSMCGARVSFIFSDQFYNCHWIVHTLIISCWRWIEPIESIWLCVWSTHTHTHIGSERGSKGASRKQRIVFDCNFSFSKLFLLTKCTDYLEMKVKVQHAKQLDHYWICKSIYI